MSDQEDETRRRRRSRSRSPARESEQLKTDDTDAGEDVGGIREKEIHGENICCRIPNHAQFARIGADHIFPI